MSGVFTIGGNLFEVLKQESHCATIKMTMPPAQLNYLQKAHRHPSVETLVVISGQAEVTHGYEQLTTMVLHQGEEVSFGSNAWHATSIASPEEALVAHLVQTPGHQWAQFIRDGAALQQAGQLPTGFVNGWFDILEVVFRSPPRGSLQQEERPGLLSAHRNGSIADRRLSASTMKQSPGSLQGRRAPLHCMSASHHLTPGRDGCGEIALFLNRRRHLTRLCQF